MLVRRGTSSQRWRQTDLPRLLERRDERIREAVRAELAETLAAVQQGQQAQRIAAGPTTAFTWELDQATHDATAVELVRRNDRTPIRLLLLRAVGDAEAALTSGDQDQLNTILDRLTSLLGIALTLTDADTRDNAVATLLAIYRLGFDVSGYRRNDLQISPARLWLDVVTRMEALGALAVRLNDWRSVRQLALQRPHTSEPGDYASWLRHGLTAAANERLTEGGDGRTVHGFLVALGRNHVHRLPALRPDRPDDSQHAEHLTGRPPNQDALLDSLCQFDFLWGLIATTASGDLSSQHFYTSFAAYYSHRTEPVVLRLLDDARMRSDLLPGVSDGLLGAAVREICRLAQGEGWRLQGRPWGFQSERMKRFLTEQGRG